MSTTDERYRGTVRGRTPDNCPATLIVTRRGLGRAGRVWLTFDGAIKTTLVMTDPETGRLADLLGAAARAR